MTELSFCLSQHQIILSADLLVLPYFCGKRKNLKMMSLMKSESPGRLANIALYEL